MKLHALPVILGSGLLCAAIIMAAEPVSVASLFDLHGRTQVASTPAAETVRQTGESRHITRENFDIRLGHQRALDNAPETTRRASGRQRTQQSIPRDSRFRLQRESSGLRFAWSSLTGSPGQVWSYTDNLSAKSRDDAEIIARRFIASNDDLFGLQTGETDALQVARRYRTEHNGVTHLTLQQQVRGVEVFQSDMTVHIDREGAVLTAQGELIAGAAEAVNLSQPRLTSGEALALAARDVGSNTSGRLQARNNSASADARQVFDSSIGFARDVEARLVYFPVTASQLRLGWQFILWLRDTPDVYLTVIDAERGSLLYRYNLTSYEENPLRPRGLVFADESPRPNLPHNGNNPPAVERVLLPFRAAQFLGADLFRVDDRHYDWWSGAAADALTGNNAQVALDINADNLPDDPQLRQPDGNFSYPLDLTQASSTTSNQQAAQVNLFYWINRFHDILYSYGFTESAGNFQTNNFGLGGIAGDAIQGDVQDGSGRNNANFTTPPDGGAGRIQMYLWSDSLHLDSALDQTVIIHELTHGLSNRLVGNATGLATMQSAAMGEGWSDFMALALLAGPDDDLHGSYPMAQYVSNNYQRGIRRYPYSTDPGVNPLTFRMIAENRQIHAIGEIWCSILWDVRATLIERYGFEQGQRTVLQLVVDGMKLAPRAPSFIDARNAILLADRVNNGSANQCLLWKAFARRGLGYSAATTDGNDSAPVEAFDNVPWCSDTATLQLDRNSYLNGELIQITLSDRNATEPVRVVISSSITSDRETIVLTRDQDAPGRFRGVVRLMAGPAVAGDGELQAAVNAGDEIRVLYHDTVTEGGALAEITTRASLARERKIFADTVEAGNQGWVTTGRWGITSQQAASPAHSWTDSPNGNYFNSDNTALISPVFDLKGLQDVTLSLTQSYQLDSGMDYALVEYSTDDGQTWQRAAAYTGLQTTFAAARIRLRGLDGQARARIRFRLVTDAQVNGDGWYIDDISLTGRSADPSIVSPHQASQPAIASVSPAFGSPVGGTRVTITGSDFSDDTIVTFDGVPASFVQVLSNATILAVTPPHVAGTVSVRLSSRIGDTALADGFTYFQPGSPTSSPAVSGLTPGAGSVRGGTMVTLFGNGFSPETQVSFGAQKAAVVYLNPYTLRVITPAAGAAGRVDVFVTNVTADVATQAVLSSGFEYLAASPPQVEVLSPAEGSTVYAGSTIGIRWQSSDNQRVAGHRVRLYRQNGQDVQVVAELASTVAGEARTWSWTIPTDQMAVSQARIGVTAIDDEGTETEAFSGGWFTIARRWTTSAQLPFTINDFAMVSDGQYLYAIGGRSSSDPSTSLNLVQRLDTQASRLIWKSTGLARLPFALSNADAVFLHGRIFLAGGINMAGRIITKHQVYDIAGNAWYEAADMPAAILSYALAADETAGRYYMTGGTEGGASGIAVATVRMYDALTDKWSELPAMNTARFGHRSALIGGRLYVAGGTGASGVLRDVEVFDFQTRQWSRIAQLNHTRQFATSAVGQDSAGNPLWFIFGGVDSSDVVAATEMYDLRNDRWLTLDESFNMPTPRAWLKGAMVNGFFHAAGGFTLMPTNIGGRLLISQPQNERINLSGVIAAVQNQAPTLTVPADLTAVTGNEISFNVTAGDLGADLPVTISADNLPPGADFQTAIQGNNRTQGMFRWIPDESQTGSTLRLSFTASDGHLSETRIINLRVVAGTNLSAVNAADYSGQAVAADSIAVIFGQNLATRPGFAQTQPLPLELNGTTVRVNGIVARLLFVSPTQINFVIPADLDIGRAGIVVSSAAGNYSAGTIQIAPTAPALFTTDASGRGDAAAIATPDGINYQSAPFDVTIDGRHNHLVLYGTGLRRAQAGDANQLTGQVQAVSVTIDGLPARVTYAGAQPFYSGLDQVNVELPEGLSGSGPRRVELVLSVLGVTANRVTVLLR